MIIQNGKMAESTVEVLKREFVDMKTNSKLPDVDVNYTPSQVRDFYANTHPHLVNATIEGPEVMKDKIKYKFVITTGTKG